MDPIEIYSDLKKKIIWLDLEPGAALNHAELAEMYNVSRNPITLALTRLDAEEWVIRSGSHFVVSPLTVDRIREITEVRSLIEVQANVWTMHRISPEGLSELRALRDKIFQVDDAAGNRKMVELDVQVHRLLYRETRNHQLAVLLDRMLSHYLRFWLSRPRTIRRDAFFEDMLEIMAAIEAKDEVGLKAASSTHIKASLDEVIRL